MDNEHFGNPFDFNGDGMTDLTVESIVYQYFKEYNLSNNICSYNLQ